jgi:SAGA-associated factor 73
MAFLPSDFSDFRLPLRIVMQALVNPVDVEAQCAVPLPDGSFCARNLACKRHSMASKRAVTGRSAPYDQLLAQHQNDRRAAEQQEASN